MRKPLQLQHTVIDYTKVIWSIEEVFLLSHGILIFVLIWYVEPYQRLWRSNWSEVDEIVLKHLVSSANCRRWLCAFYTAKIGIFLHKRWQLPYCQKWQHHIGHIAYLDFFLFLLDGKWSIGHPCFLVDMIIECISQAKLYPGWPSTWPPSLLN